VPRYAVQLRFASDDDRNLLIPRLRDLAGTGGLTTDETGDQLAFADVESPIAAIVAAQILIHRACSGTDVAPASVRRSPAR